MTEKGIAPSGRPWEPQAGAGRDRASSGRGCGRDQAEARPTLPGRQPAPTGSGPAERAQTPPPAPRARRQAPGRGRTWPATGVPAAHRHVCPSGSARVPPLSRASVPGSARTVARVTGWAPRGLRAVAIVVPQVPGAHSSCRCLRTDPGGRGPRGRTRLSRDGAREGPARLLSEGAPAGPALAAAACRPSPCGRQRPEAHAPAAG